MSRCKLSLTPVPMCAQSGCSCDVAYKQGHRHCVRQPADVSGPAGGPHGWPDSWGPHVPQHWCVYLHGILVIWTQAALLWWNRTHFWHCKKEPLIEAHYSPVCRVFHFYHTHHLLTFSWLRRSSVTGSHSVTREACKLLVLVSFPICVWSTMTVGPTAPSFLTMASKCPSYLFCLVTMRARCNFDRILDMDIQGWATILNPLDGSEDSWL